MAKRPTKYVFVTGGVLSGVGKGITAASIGNILKNRGLKVNIQKCDPYLNVDAGTLNPAEHGECFVTFDGAETDLDLGHYERFMDVEVKSTSSLMSGRVLLDLIQAERSGRFLGKTVQVIPHLTNAIQEYILAAAEGNDVHIVEVGGTVGDYESPAFIEAIRELGMRVGRKNSLFVHVVYLPYLGASKELKTKPAQNAIRDLRGVGIVPDILVARSEGPAPKDVISKLSLFSGVEPRGIALLPNAKNIYQVPLELEDMGIGGVITERLGLRTKKANLKAWRAMVKEAAVNQKPRKRIGIVAKYLNNQDTYISVFEALKAAGWANKTKLDLVWVDAEKLENPRTDINKAFAGLDGIVVPGGFGKRAIEGKIKAAQYALKHKLPYLGLCLGLQIAVIAAARSAGLSKANSTEFDPGTPDPVISTMDDQKGKENTGGTMRLGNYPCVFVKNSLSAKLYAKKSVDERHRHRYECNNLYRNKYEKWGIMASGISPDGRLVEMVEAIDHPFFVSSQFHPEFRSRPNQPHPMFDGFVEAISKHK